jgi:hypothetical protein
VTIHELVEALRLPDAARVDQRVSKTLLAQHGSRTAADRRYITDGIETMRWVAALKPTTIGVPAYRDTEREYPEVAVLSAELRFDSKATRLLDLIHRASPYPLLLLVLLRGSPLFSLAHKRRSLAGDGETVLDGSPVTVPLEAPAGDDLAKEFVARLALQSQPRTDMYALYQGWMACAVALQAARLTGTFTVPAGTQALHARRRALAAVATLDARIAQVRSAAAREQPIRRRVELNQELAQLRRDYASALGQLGGRTDDAAIRG